MSQSDLAKASGLALATVQKAEQGGSLRGPTWAMVYRGLNTAGLLSGDEAELFKRLTGLTGLPQPNDLFDPKSVSPERISLRRFTSTMPPEVQRCYWLVADLLDHAGVTNTLNMLESLAKMSRMVVENPVPMEVVESTDADHPMLGAPPRTLPDGSIEQRFVPAAGVRTTNPGESTSVTKATQKPDDSSKRKHA